MIRIYKPTLAGLALVVSLMTSASPLSAQTTYTINSLGARSTHRNPRDQWI